MRGSFVCMEDLVRSCPKMILVLLIEEFRDQQMYLTLVYYVIFCGQTLLTKMPLVNELRE